MKTRFILVCLSLCLAVLPRSLAQDESSSVRSQEELDQLFGPIALYPDALIALILPASTVPSDVVMAARYLRSTNDPTRVDGQSWDDSVKSLSHYPDVVKWMDENLAWTKQAGEAFASQPADVMNAIQRLRAAARAAGTLVDTPQQSVVMEGDDITIVPADPEVIYVPSYDPEVVYISRPGYYHDPFLTFGIGFSTGVWLGYDFDWGRHRLWSIDRRDRERYWRERRDHDWHGSPRVVPGPGHPRIVDDNHFRHQEWHPRPDVRRPAHVSGGVVRNDSNRPDNNSPHRTPDQRNDSHRNEADRQTDDHRWRHGPDNSNSNGRGRPNSNNNTAPAVVNTNSRPSPQQPTRTAPAPAPAVANPSASSQPTTVAPRQDRDQRDRGQREARENDRSVRTQNPQGRVMQSPTSAQPRQADNRPTLVNREARASEPSPQRARAVESQPRAPQVVSSPQPSRAAQAAPPSRQDSSGGNDRKDRDDRRDRSQR